MAKTKTVHPKHAAPKAQAALTWLSRFWPPKNLLDRVILIGSGVLLLLVVLFGVPMTRYAILGHFAKRDVTVVVTDDRSHKPVTDVAVQFAGITSKTDAKGSAKFAKVPVGRHDVVTNKKYYGLLTEHVLVPLTGTGTTFRLQVTAIGNQVAVKVVNTITGKVLSRAKIDALGATTTTDASGEALLILPVGHNSEIGIVKLDGYNDLPVSITNTEQLTAANTFHLVPSGKVYFLSKRTGKINVMKSDLDGSNPEVVVAGTGHESDSGTVLRATHDWKYLALFASRDSSRAALYLINTATGQLSLMDQNQGTESFDILGWYGHYFVYELHRTDFYDLVPGRTVVESYDAEQGRVRDLVISDGHEISTPQFFDGYIVYVQNWPSKLGYTANPVRMNMLSAIKPDGSGKTDVLSSRAEETTYGGLTLAAPQLLYYYSQPTRNGSQTFYSLKPSWKTTQIDYNTFSSFSPNFLISPTGDRTFWSEGQGEVNSLFIGDGSGGGSKQLPNPLNFSPYGWFTDDFVLLSKNWNELFIAPADMSVPATKITDIHPPALGFNGLGGYGND